MDNYPEFASREGGDLGRICEWQRLCSGGHQTGKRHSYWGDLYKEGHPDWGSMVDPAENPQEPGCWDPRRHCQSVHLPISHVHGNIPTRLLDHSWPHSLKPSPGQLRWNTSVIPALRRLRQGTESSSPACAARLSQGNRW